MGPPPSCTWTTAPDGSTAVEEPQDRDYGPNNLSDSGNYQTQAFGPFVVSWFLTAAFVAFVRHCNHLLPRSEYRFRLVTSRGRGPAIEVGLSFSQGLVTTSMPKLCLRDPWRTTESE